MQDMRWAARQPIAVAVTLALCAHAGAQQPEQQLPEVRVQSSEVRPNEHPRPYAGGQVTRGGRLGLLGNADVLNAPFNITNYTAQTIEDQQARYLWDVLINDPSVRLSSAQRNINEDFSIRGFPVTSQDVALNGMYGLMPHFRVPIEMAERVEVLKGPSALLNGMPLSGNIGGAINLVPKRAGLEPLTPLLSVTSRIRYSADMPTCRVVSGHRGSWAARERRLPQGRYADRRADGERDVGSVALDYVGERLRFRSI